MKVGVTFRALIGGGEGTFSPVRALHFSTKVAVRRAHPPLDWIFTKVTDMAFNFVVTGLYKVT